MRADFAASISGAEYSALEAVGAPAVVLRPDRYVLGWGGDVAALLRLKPVAH